METDKRDYNVTIVGFHGTLFDSAQKIIAEKEFKTGEYRNDHWLGQGIYFFREDYEQAKSWAQSKMKHHQQDGAVIKTTIKLNRDSFLNLDSREDIFEFSKLKKAYIRYCKEEKIEISADPTILRCAICNQLPEEIKVIQRTFSGNAVFNNDLQGTELILHGTQVCVRDTAVLDYTKTGICGVVYLNVPIQKRKRKHKQRTFSEKE